LRSLRVVVGREARCQDALAHWKIVKVKLQDRLALRRQILRTLTLAAGCHQKAALLAAQGAGDYLKQVGLQGAMVEMQDPGLTVAGCHSLQA
jgi:hypothetical protein